MSRVPLSVPMAAASSVLARPPRRLIDLRSPAEFALDRVPGALNVPLFDDTERALIGTLYARHSPEAAFDEGRRRTLERIRGLTEELAQLCGWEPPGDDLNARVERMTAKGIASLEQELLPAAAENDASSVVLYCWRGGLRSRSVVALLRGLGHGEVLGIEGGYRAYRQVVRRTIEAWEGPPSYVLRGLTGVGKTLVLHALERLRPGWTIDLEGLARHRSSILGAVGLEPASQKRFESDLAVRLGALDPRRCVLEGESRKVGDLVLPEPIWRKIDAGVSIELHADRARRVRVLADDYLASEKGRAELEERLPFIEQRLGPRWHGELVARLGDGREDELVEILLERYYDPLYRHSERGRVCHARVDSSDPERAAAEIARWIESRERAVRAREGGAARVRGAAGL